MSKKKVCCSFDFENDRLYYQLLEAWNENPRIDFSINDGTPSEIQSCSVSVVKQRLSVNIGNSNYMIAIIGKHSNDTHPDSKEIGYKNWQAYEIEKNYEKGNGLVIVKLDSSCIAPAEALGKGAEWITGFNLDSINKALKNLSE